MRKLALHETLELHELLTLKSLSLTKLSVMSPLVQDDELRTIMKAEMDAGNAAVERIQQVFNNKEDVQ